MASYSFDASSLVIEYPDLPVVQKRDFFLETLKSNQVLIVKADTGSGKSTQLPKFLLESGITMKGRIGVTQPRRLAALSVADRLRDELKQSDLVKTRIRFLEEGSPNAPIKVMTDGILLQEFRRDRFFRNYSAIMIDEAHERSLNIDILLGIFKTVLPARPEFRLVIASATLDAKLFGSFYSHSAIIEAEGRTYPVEVEYRDPKQDLEKNTRGDSGLLEEAAGAILDLMKRKRDHLLCFLPTERDIQDLQADLKSELDERLFEVFPLFGRMSPSDQRKVFHHSSKTKIVLSTNIAETSLTIPGIAYVVDTGFARISRYNTQSRIQALPVEKISKASARQRAGRAGRVKPGYCIRLYSEESFEDRPEFTEPEIRRSNLANVVLQLQSLNLSVEKFPFLQPPLRSAFRSAYKTLHELGAITQGDAGAEVTELGKSMAGLPMDVALSAVLLRARERHVLQPALIICAALSIQDPRLFPPEDPEKSKAREMHRKMNGHKSDFLVFLAIWNDFCKSWDTKSWNQLRKLCETRWLHFLRCREWIDLYEQFCQILKIQFKDKICPFTSFHRDHLHSVLLSGFLGGVAHFDKENQHYKTVTGREASIFPGSDLFRKSPEWIFSAEIRETSRVYLTQNAEIRPEWILNVAEPFCTRRWFNPQWNPTRGFVEASEEVSFRTMVLFRGRRVDYARINPEECAPIFFREAVVLFNMPKPFSFMEHNRRVLEKLQNTEAKLRRWGIAPSEEEQLDFYLAKAPEVYSLITLRDFIEKNTDQALRFSEEFWLKRTPEITKQHERFQNNPSFTLLNPSSKPAETKPAKGGRVEVFHIAGENVFGELVFDASQKWDGLSLKIPPKLFSKITPAFLAKHIPQWRNWIMEAFIKELPQKMQVKLNPFKELWDDSFYSLLESKPGAPPFLLLVESFSETSLSLENTPLIRPEKDFHLNLHLTLFSSENEKPIRVDLSPFWGEFHFFEALRHTYFSSEITLGNGRYGWRLDKNVWMAPSESSFWQEFFQRISGENKLSIEIYDLLQNRLSFLESLFSIEFPVEKTSRDWIFKSLISGFSENIELSELSNKLKRFNGIHFPLGKKLNSFQELTKNVLNREEQVRFTFILLVWESALLGLDMFIKAWQFLRKSFDFINNKNEFQDSWKMLAENFQKETSTYWRLQLITQFLSENPKEKIIKEDEPIFESPKELREKFRPYLLNCNLSETEQKEIKSTLSLAEKAWREKKNYFEFWVQAGILLESLSVKTLPRRNDEAEEVDALTLQNLKNRFNRI